MSGTGMKVLVAKLEMIQRQCDPDFGKKKKGKKADPSDAFSAKKKEIADELRGVRESLKERDQLLGKHASAATTVELSAKIRSRLKNAKENAVELEGILENMKKKAGKKPTQEQSEAIELKTEQLDAVRKHIDEVGRLEKRRHAVGGDARSRLVGAGAAAGVGIAPLPNDPTDSSLAPIDDETLAELQLLEEGNLANEREMDELAEGVAALRGIALEMGREIDVQNVMLDNLNAKTDITNATIRNVNKQLTKILKDVRTDQMCTYIILAMVLLFLVLFVFNKSQGR